MRDEIRMILGQSQYFGLAVSVAAYLFAAWLRKKTKLAILNPLLISSALIIGCLVCVGMDYETYNKGAGFLGWLLTPATVCLAIPLYEQVELLKKHSKAIVLGLISGVITSLVCVLVLALLFHFDHAQYVTLLPKSITTAIGMGISEELGGYVTLTVAIIIITGILGSVLAETACRIFKITEPVARGVAIGTASHAIGTSKAMEMGETEGAISGLSIAVAGLLTVVGASVFSCFL